MQLNLFEQEEDPEVDKSTGERLIFCKDCNTHKPTSAYSKLLTTGQGKQYYVSRCKPCQNKRVQTTRHIKLTAPAVGTHCECCGIDFALVVNKNIHMDHCPVEDVFRGWLCRNCNVGLGCFGYDLKGIEKAVAYLRKHDERS